MSRAFAPVVVAVLAAGILVVAGASAPALASPGYPSEMRSHLGGSATPQCTVCHATNAGGIGTITKDFGKALVDRGLVLEDNTSLDGALDQLDADGVDSDGDGVTDIAEVKVGTDPNVAGAASDGGPALTQDPIQYGFGCASSSSASIVDATALAIVGTAVLVGRRRRR